jgi:nitrile hydratase subunit alpha
MVASHSTFDPTRPTSRKIVKSPANCSSWVSFAAIGLPEKYLDRNDQMHDEHDHDHGSQLTDMEVRVRALESILLEKGYVDPKALDVLIETYETQVGPHNGAAVIAKAWADPAYRARLLQDGSAAIAELGFGGRQGEHMVVVENTDKVHNIIVCTLCSCYPWPVLGLPPVWYKSAPYRSRAVLDPRSVLADFGLRLADDKEIKVWDSTAEIRYLVMPERPAGTDGWSEERLASLVTRDSMIGTGVPKQPAEVS